MTNSNFFKNPNMTLGTKKLIVALAIVGCLTIVGGFITTGAFIYMVLNPTNNTSDGVINGPSDEFTEVAPPYSSDGSIKYVEEDLTMEQAYNLSVSFFNQVIDAMPEGSVVETSINPIEDWETNWNGEGVCYQSASGYASYEGRFSFSVAEEYDTQEGVDNLIREFETNWQSDEFTMERNNSLTTLGYELEFTHNTIYWWNWREDLGSQMEARIQISEKQYQSTFDPDIQVFFTTPCYKK